MFVIDVLEAWRDRAAEQGERRTPFEHAALPDTARHDELALLACGEVVAKDDRLARAVGKKLQHADWVTEIGVEYLIARQTMQRGACPRCEEVVDGGTEGAGPDIASRQGLRRFVGAVCLPEVAAFPGMGL